MHQPFLYNSSLDIWCSMGYLASDGLQRIHARLAFKFLKGIALGIALHSLVGRSPHELRNLITVCTRQRNVIGNCAGYLNKLKNLSQSIPRKIDNISILGSWSVAKKDPKENCCFS
jgi:hypothetical protein